MPKNGVTYRAHLDRVLMAFDYARIDGWLYLEDAALREIQLVVDGHLVHVERERLRLPSPDISLDPSCRFSISILLPDAGLRTDVRLRCVLESGAVIEFTLEEMRAEDLLTPTLFKRFVDLVREEGRRSILEIGSRMRRGVSYRQWFDGLEYTGIDIVKDSNVDQVVDAHRLSEVFGRGRFDAAYSLVVFEHLAMPWKVAVEMNRVMRVGALAYVLSVQTCGLHELPWDFFRFSDSAYRALFNHATGFEVIGTSLTQPMHIFPFMHLPGSGAEKAAGWSQSEVLVRKIAETTLDWPVALEDVIEQSYPE